MRKLRPHDLVGAVTLVAAAMALRRLDDADTWWHLASGRWIVENGTVPVTDPFSYTASGHAWVNLQWLYDAVLYGLFRLGGPNLLVLAAAATYATAVWLLLRNVRLSLAPPAAAWLTLAAVLIAEERFFVRPEMASFLLLQAVLWLLLTAREHNGRRLWLLAPLMLVWANMHALFVVGLLCIGATVLSALASRLPFLPAGWRAASRLTPEAERRLFLWSALAALAVLANPYGLRGALFPLRLLSRIDPDDPVFQSIAEFRPPFSGFLPSLNISLYQALFATGAIAVGAAVIIAARPPRWSAARHTRPRKRAGRLTTAAPEQQATSGAGIDVATLLIFGALAYLSVLARRNMALFALGATPLIARSLAVLGAQFRRHPQAVPAWLAGAPAALLLVLCVTLTAAVATNWYYRFAGIPHEFGLGILESSFPMRAAQFARETGLPPRLYNDLTAGGYLVWDRPVPGGVFIDGRLEVYDRDFFATYIDGLLSPAAWRRDADRFGIQSALVFHRWSSRQNLVAALLRDPRWALVYHDEAAILFVRKEGNEALVAAAQSRFAERYARNLATLRASATPAWRWPAEKVEALEGYAKLHFMIGRGDVGLALSDRLLGIGLPARREAAVRLRAARYLAGVGRSAEAKEHLRRAGLRDPGNQGVKALLVKLGG